MKIGQKSLWAVETLKTPRIERLTNEEVLDKIRDSYKNVSDPEETIEHVLGRESLLKTTEWVVEGHIGKGTSRAEYTTQIMKNMNTRSTKP